LWSGSPAPLWSNFLEDEGSLHSRTTLTYSYTHWKRILSMLGVINISSWHSVCGGSHPLLDPNQDQLHISITCDYDQTHIRDVVWRVPIRALFIRIDCFKSKYLYLIMESCLVRIWVLQDPRSQVQWRIDVTIKCWRNERSFCKNQHFKERGLPKGI